MAKRFSVAVRPTPKEVQDNDFWYDKDYYEAREGVYEVETEQEALEEYFEEMINFLHPVERKYCRPIDIGTSYNYQCYLNEQTRRK